MAANRRVLLIALTGWGQESDHSRSRAAGFDHHVVKPPNVETLRELLAG
jgi:CheY-like chemotaxis protein